MDDATRTQNNAANPDHSVWLSANAGSGKTRVLTDRVARHLLRGVDPQNILCLTYTKAAASEMQNRLFATLGAWSMLDDASLKAALAKLDEPAPDDLALARTLFARAVETPGGLKIQTIHSFCSALLRQFPLEAGVPPQFREIDEAEQSALIETVLDDMARAGDAALTGIARITSSDLSGIAKSVLSKADAFARPKSREDLFRLYDLSPDFSEQHIVDNTLSARDVSFLKTLAPLLARSSKNWDQALAQTITRLSDRPILSDLISLFPHVLTQEGNIKSRRSPTAEMLKDPAFLPNHAGLETIVERLAHARQALDLLTAAQKTAALHSFAERLLAAYTKAKEEQGVLDFDDLIDKTLALLDDRSLQWVLYRIDGQINHVLIDESQDTSPKQWRIIRALTQEFTAEAGSRNDVHRTMFVVGDKKQSIYSFQGANAREFERVQSELTSNTTMENKALHVSFRSSSAVLQTVDALLALDRIEGVDNDVRHEAYHRDLPGRVDLWPLVEKPKTEEAPPWYAPVDLLSDSDPDVVLAKEIASSIREMIDTGVLPTQDGAIAIEPRHITVLVQRRSPLFHEVIRACKNIKIPIAGADRLQLGAELAVKDVLALLHFLATQDDDLALATALRSPLFGWSEADLYDLAQGRAPGLPLWAELRNRKDDFPQAWTTLSALRDKVDFFRPYDLIEHILTACDGRRNLVARLGHEAEDGLNELLTQAMAHEQRHVPSLTTFLADADTWEVDIKRQNDTTSNHVRVMTVHGAKGLESEIVFLPDTTRSDPTARQDIVTHADGTPLWPVSSDFSPDIVTQAKNRQKQAEVEERNRLLYVAMTRAKNWLVIAGTASAKTPAHDWYSAVSDAISTTGQPIDTPIGQGHRIQHGIWPDPDTVTRKETGTVSAEIPDFITTPAPTAQGAATPLKSPSNLGGSKVLGGGALDEEAAKRRGRQIHLLLEHGAGRADLDWFATRLLAAGADAAMPEEIPGLVAEARQAFEKNPDVFSADALSEVDVSAFLPESGFAISGTIDRLLVASDRVLAIDFKTNAVVPDRPDQTPDGILRQMAAYLEALEQIWPDRTIDLAILWTATGDLMDLPHGIVREALHPSTTS